MEPKFMICGKADNYNGKQRQIQTYEFQSTHTKITQKL